jgi:hypothetical protein
VSWKINILLTKGLVILLAEKVVFAGIRGGHFLGREVAILLAEGWSLLAERVVFVGRRHVF